MSRLMNMAVNPFVRMNPVGNEQKGVYLFGNGSAEGLEGGQPAWVYGEFPVLTAQDTQDTRLQMPDNFTVLAFLASSSLNTKGGFRVYLYDVNRRLRLIERPATFQAFAGQGGSPLFLRVPYHLAQMQAQIMVRAASLEPGGNTDAQIVIYGVIGGQH